MNASGNHGAQLNKCAPKKVFFFFLVCGSQCRLQKLIRIKPTSHDLISDYSHFPYSRRTIGLPTFNS